MTRGTLALALAACASDASTGLLLVVAPGAVLGLLRLPVPDDPVFVRWLGVFVLAVGLAYAWPFLWRDPRARTARLVAAFELTALVRFAVAAFLAVAVGSGALAPGGLGIAAFDAAVAAAQVALLARGAVGHVA